jgi:hypothetical protein
MLIKKPLFLISIFFVLISCNNTNENKKALSEDVSLASKYQKIKYEIVSTGTSNGIKIEDLSFDTATLFNNTKGIKVIFNIEVSKEVLEAIRKKGFSAFFFNLKCEPDKGNSYSIYNKITKEKGKKSRINPDNECFVSHQTKRGIEIILPYRLLEMECGTHDLHISIDAFPARFKEDTLSYSTKILDYISSEAYTSLKARVRIYAPKLFKVAIEIQKFKLNTEALDPTKFDFSIGGNGYPDLYWDVYCGDDFLYYSPVIKNAISYNNKQSTNSFYCTKDDVIKINFADYDNGPFNSQPDIIETWEGLMNDLPVKPDTLSLRNLKYLILQTKITE